MVNLKSTYTDRLFQAILSLKTIDECYMFFEDVCTIQEVQEIAQRYWVACLLNEGKIYSEIVKETGASTATISRVNKCLIYGSNGYKVALEREKNNQQDTIDEEKTDE